MLYTYIVYLWLPDLFIKSDLSYKSREYGTRMSNLYVARARRWSFYFMFMSVSRTRDHNYILCRILSCTFYFKPMFGKIKYWFKTDLKMPIMTYGLIASWYRIVDCSICDYKANCYSLLKYYNKIGTYFMNYLVNVKRFFLNFLCSSPRRPCVPKSGR